MALPDHFPITYHKNFLARVGQKKSRLRQFVTPDDTTKDRKRYSRLGETGFQEYTTRHRATVINTVTDDFRWAYLVKADTTLLRDEWDEAELGEILLPNSEFINRQVTQYNRHFDSKVIGACIGNAKGGADGTTDIPLPTSQKITEAGTAGLTAAKIRRAARILNEADNLDEEDPVMGDRVMVISAQEWDQILSITEVVSSDYNVGKPLVNGKLLMWMGFTFVVSQQLPVASGKRTLVAFCRGGIRAATEIRPGSIGTRLDLSEAEQIRSKWRTGATRLHDEMVVTIESAVS